MPIEAAIVVTLVVLAFGVFAATLAWGHRRAGGPPVRN
jgi:hypothetical protein